MLDIVGSEVILTCDYCGEVEKLPSYAEDKYGKILFLPGEWFHFAVDTLVIGTKIFCGKEICISEMLNEYRKYKNRCDVSYLNDNGKWFVDERLGSLC